MMYDRNQYFEIEPFILSAIFLERQVDSHGYADYRWEQRSSSKGYRVSYLYYLGKITQYISIYSHLSLVRVRMLIREWRRQVISSQGYILPSFIWPHVRSLACLMPCQVTEEGGVLN